MPTALASTDVRAVVRATYAVRVTGSVLRFERLYDLPPEIVWDALVDSDLVSGWLAEADIEPHEGGRYDLEWRHFEPAMTTSGSIEEMHELARLVVATSNFGTTTFTLESLEQGTRGLSTLLHVDVEALADLQFSAPIEATWQLCLAQLDELLHGHPTDWSTWRETHGRAWHELVSQAQRKLGVAPT